MVTASAASPPGRRFRPGRLVPGVRRWWRDLADTASVDGPVAATANDGTRRWWRRGVQLAVGLVLLQVVGYLGSLAGELVPDRAVANSLVRALDAGQLSAANYGVSPSGNQIDHFTECISLTEGLGDHVDQSPFVTAITSPYLGSCGVAVPQLEQFRRSGKLPPGTYYYRYWHGYTPLTRPLLAVMGVGGTRWVLGLLLYGCTAGFVVLLCRRYGWFVAAGLTLPLLLATDFLELADTVPHTVAWITWAVAGAVAVAVAGRSSSDLRWSAAVIGVAAGFLSAYADLMVAMPATLALVTAVVALEAVRRGRITGRNLSAVAVTPAAWAAAMGVTWLAKWALAALVVGPSAVKDNVEHQIGFRLSGHTAVASGGFGSATLDNARALWHRPLGAITVVAVALLALVWLIGVLRSGGRGSAMAGAALVAGCAVLVPCWYEALSNHSQIHFWLTYRSLAVSLGIVASAVCISVRRVSGVGRAGPPPIGTEPAASRHQ